MIKEFDLNVEKVLENWSISDAIREIIANALDEQIITRSDKIQIFKDNYGNWHIRDFGRGIEYKHLTQNENEEKKSNPNLIGQFGVGLKDALATFDRHNKQIKIISKYGIISLGKSKKYGFDDIITLHAYIDTNVDKNFVGTDFIISNCEDSDINKAKKLFLIFNKSNLLEKTIYGEIYRKDSMESDIYINGVKVASEKNFLFSYNITSLNGTLRRALNRERTNVGRSAYSDRIKSILLKVEGETVLSVLANNLNKYKEGNLADELTWTDVATHAVKVLNTGKNAIFVTSDELEHTSSSNIEILKGSGKQLIVIPSNVKGKIENEIDIEGNKINTVDTIISDYNDSFEYEFIEYDKLTNQEKEVYNTVIDIINSYGNEEYFDKIYISETLRPGNYYDTTVGVYESLNDRIIISRSQLKSIYEFAGTLMHELVHANKRFVDLERNFETELTRIIGKLLGYVINNDLLKNINLNN